MPPIQQCLWILSFMKITMWLILRIWHYLKGYDDELKELNQVNLVFDPILSFLWQFDGKKIYKMVP
jgi:hypothetical protein